MINKERIAENIRIIRTFKNLSATELSQKAGLKQVKRISDIEDLRGAINLEEAISICKILEIGLDDLLFKTPRIIFEFPSETD